MQYNEAKTVRVGDTLLIKQSNYRSTHVLEITHNSLYHTFRFRCTDGEFYHKEHCIHHKADGSCWIGLGPA